MAITEAKMHSTFVPDEALTLTRPILFGPDRPSPEPRSESMSLGTPGTRYDLFRSRHEPELYCAVPEGRPGPAFVHSDRWLPVGRMDEAAATPPGFDRKAARVAVRFNGFYLFIAFDGVPSVHADSAGGLPWRLLQEKWPDRLREQLESP
jgi:hypothetical protein